MQKEEWITWKTEVDEIINPDLIEKKMDAFFSDYNSKMQPIIYESIKNEILKGGLSKKSFNVSGESPSNEMAIEIIHKIEEIDEVYKNLKNKVNKMANEQKNIEKTELIRALENKIKEEEEYVKNVEVPVTENKNISSISNDIVHMSYDQINRLKEKLERVELL